MDVRYLLLARHAEMAGDGTLNMLGGGVDLQPVPALPFGVPILYVVLKADFGVQEGSCTHAFQLRAFNPAGEQFLDSGSIDMPSQAPFPPNRDRAQANVVLALQNILFTAEGVYRFELLYDGESVKDALLRVELAGKVSASPEFGTDGGTGS
jgi:hypothetical protein